MGTRRKQSNLYSIVPFAVVLAGLLALGLLAILLPKAKPGPSVATATSPLPTSTWTPTFTPRPTRTPTLTPLPTSTPTDTPLPPLIHVVQRGEVVGIIARQYGVTTSAILEANRLAEDDYIRVGQELIIPRPTPTAQPNVQPTEAVTTLPSETPPPSGPPPAVPEEQVYTVQSGDTLSSIAKDFDTSVSLLMDRNNITDPSLLQIGQVIIIPRGTPTPLPTPTFRPTNTPIPGPPYGAPVLLWPANGTVYRGPDAAVLVQWASVGFLKPDEWYVVRVKHAGKVVAEEWTKANAWRLPLEARPDPKLNDHRLFWDVSVMRQQGLQPGRGTTLVAAGEMRWVEWY